MSSHDAGEPSISVAEYRRRLISDDLPMSGTGAFRSTLIDVELGSPFIGAAVHSSSRIRPSLQDNLYASQETRFHEEDPYTNEFLGLLPHTLVPNQSRFEVDFNRSPYEAVYATPDMCWGIQVWNQLLSSGEHERSLEKWYEFHSLVDAAVEHAIATWGRAYVFEFHSYNYQREGPTDWRQDGKACINLGTKHLTTDNEGRKFLDRVIELCKEHTLEGEPMQVDENGVFYGGYLNRRLTRTYGAKVVPLSIEYKKVFMDENTGLADQAKLDDLVRQMDQTIKTLGSEFGAPVRSASNVPRVERAAPKAA